MCIINKNRGDRLSMSSGTAVELSNCPEAPIALQYTHSPHHTH